ncbi:MAG: SDR family NAD(P)-dependent oxidoreductase [Solirubrobacteraceae bacterium]
MTSPLGLSERVAIVTGAGGGLGLEFALALATAGARVACVDLIADAAQATADAVRDAGGEAVAVVADVADEAATRAMAQSTIEAFGAIDALVNNAAVYAGLERCRFDEISVVEWDRVMAVNLRGPWLCARACADALRRARGSIVNVSSATVLSGSPLWAHYVASKSALIGLSRVMARELGADGVRVNVIAPGFTLTDDSRDLIENAEEYGVARGAIPRALEPTDIVGAVLFLVAEARR